MPHLYREWYMLPLRERERGKYVIIKLLPLSLSPLSVTHKSSIRMSTTQILATFPPPLSLSLLAYKMIEAILTWYVTWLCSKLVRHISTWYTIILSLITDEHCHTHSLNRRREDLLWNTELKSNTNARLINLLVSDWYGLVIEITQWLVDNIQYIQCLVPVYYIFWFSHYLKRGHSNSMLLSFSLFLLSVNYAGTKKVAL